MQAWQIWLRLGALRSRWLWPVAYVLGAQTAVQASNLVIGLLILRYLRIADYAIYTIAGTLAGIGAVFANMSLQFATSYQVARAGEDRERLAAVVASAATLQYVLLGFAVLGVGGIGLSYRHQFGSDLEFAAVLGVVLVNIVLAARLELARSVFYALQTARPVVVADAAIAAARVTIILPILFLASSAGALPVLFGNALAQFSGFISLRRPFAAERRAPNRAVMRRLLRYMVPLWPENLYYLLQGNLAALVLAWVGTHSQIAELGALTRLVQIVMILAILNRFLVQPYAARYTSQTDFRHRALRVLAVYAAGAALLLLLACLFPQPLLMILGDQYEHLTALVFPVMALAVASLGGAVAYWLCLSSGQPGGLSLTIPFNLAIQVAYVGLVGLATVETALGFMLATAIGELLVRLAVLSWLALRPDAIATSERTIE